MWLANSAIVWGLHVLTGFLDHHLVNRVLRGGQQAEEGARETAV